MKSAEVANQTIRTLRRYSTHNDSSLVEPSSGILLAERSSQLIYDYALIRSDGVEARMEYATAIKASLTDEKSLSLRETKSILYG